MLVSQVIVAFMDDGHVDQTTRHNLASYELALMERKEKKNVT